MDVINFIERELTAQRTPLANGNPELLLITGQLDFKAMSHLIQLIESRLINLKLSAGIISRTKILSTEIIQNAFKHGQFLNNSFFAIYIDAVNQELVLKSGNSVLKSKTPELHQKLNDISMCPKDKLQELYVKMLRESVNKTDGNAGLGLISMYYRSKGLVTYNFSEFSDELNYFTIQVLYKF